MSAFFVVALYILLPIALLTSHSLPSGVFYGLLVVALGMLIERRFKGVNAQISCYGWLLVSYSLLFLVVVASSVYYGSWAGANSEGALRFMLGLGVLLLALPL